MAGGSLLIACSPGYATLGLGAPARLLLARRLPEYLALLVKAYGRAEWFYYYQVRAARLFPCSYTGAWVSRGRGRT